MEKGPDDAGPSNQGGNPRYRLGGISLVTDLLPLLFGFIVGRLLSVSNCIVVDSQPGLMWASPHSAYFSLQVLLNVYAADARLIKA